MFQLISMCRPFWKMFTSRSRSANGSLIVAINWKTKKKLQCSRRFCYAQLSQQSFMFFDDYYYRRPTKFGDLNLSGISRSCVRHHRLQDIRMYKLGTQLLLMAYSNVGTRIRTHTHTQTEDLTDFHPVFHSSKGKSQSVCCVHVLSHVSYMCSHFNF